MAAILDACVSCEATQYGVFSSEQRLKLLVAASDKSMPPGATALDQKRTHRKWPTGDDCHCLGPLQEIHDLFTVCIDARVSDIGNI